MLYGPEYWLSAKEKGSGEFIDAFLSDPSLCRLYLGLSKLDPETAEELRKAMPVQRLRAYSHVLDFFGGMFEIREWQGSGARRRAVGGGLDRTGRAFRPIRARRFLRSCWRRTTAGWPASTTLWPASTVRCKDYLTEPARMKRFYAAIRGRVTSPGPARPVFRSNADMMLLTTRLQLDPNGKPHIPGSLEVWKDLFVHHPQGKYDGKLTKLAATLEGSRRRARGAVRACRKAVENEPLKIFMAMSDLDRQPSHSAGRRDGGPAGAGVPRLRRAVRDFQRCAVGQRQDHQSVPRYGGRHQQDPRSAAALRYRRHHAGAGGLVADLLPPGIAAGLPRRTHAFRDPDAASRQVHGDRDVFDGGSGRREAAAGGYRREGGRQPAGPYDRSAGRRGDTADTESHTALVEEMIRILQASAFCR